MIEYIMLVTTRKTSIKQALGFYSLHKIRNNTLYVYEH